MEDDLHPDLGGDGGAGKEVLSNIQDEARADHGFLVPRESW